MVVSAAVVRIPFVSRAEFALRLLTITPPVDGLQRAVVSPKLTIDGFVIAAEPGIIPIIVSVIFVLVMEHDDISIIEL